MAIFKGRAKEIIQSLILAVFFFGFPSMLLAGDYVVITNKDVSASSLSKSELQSIFLGERTKWDDGKHINIVILAQGDVHKSFLQDIVEKTPSQYESFWKKLIFTGKATAPKSLDSIEKIVEYVAGQQGAIGYVSVGQANGSVKIITIK
jgi:ABC-type phosphate transport system substrate-binding protein